MREIFFLDRLSPVVLGALLVAVIAAAIAMGRVALLAHIHFATERDSGEQLNPIAAFLGTGSGILTATPGWLAAAFFALAVLRLEAGPLEPPPGSMPTERRSVAQLRSGLRAEFRIVRMALTGLTFIALVDAARALEYVVAALRGNTVAADSMPMTLAEAGGLVAAATALGMWVWRFRAQLDRLGAL